MLLIRKPEMEIKSGLSVPLMEQYYTIQGEGINVGKAAYFIRLAGCDVGCVWCDVKDSWDVKKHPEITVKDIVKNALQHPTRMAVITGGEPLMHNLDHLCNELRKSGYTTCIETSGAYPLSGSWDWICVSPKKFKAPLKSVLTKANELKVIVYNKSDFNWAAEQAAFVNERCKLLLQPEYGRFTEVMPLIVDYVKLYPQWQISIQTHKFINVP